MKDVKLNVYLLNNVEDVRGSKTRQKTATWFTTVVSLWCCFCFCSVSNYFLLLSRKLIVFEHFFPQMNFEEKFVIETFSAEATFLTRDEVCPIFMGFSFSCTFIKNCLTLRCSTVQLVGNLPDTGTLQLPGGGEGTNLKMSIRLQASSLYKTMTAATGGLPSASNFCVWMGTVFPIWQGIAFYGLICR